MAEVGPRTESPAEWSSGLDTEGREIRIWVHFDPATRAITRVDARRDLGCQWNTVVLGVGAGNSPNTTNKSFPVPEGDSTLPQSRLNQLANRGVATIDQFDALQITAVTA